MDYDYFNEGWFRLVYAEIVEVPAAYGIQSHGGGEILPIPAGLRQLCLETNIPINPGGSLTLISSKKKGGDIAKGGYAEEEIMCSLIKNNTQIAQQLLNLAGSKTPPRTDPIRLNNRSKTDIKWGSINIQHKSKKSTGDGQVDRRWLDKLDQEIPMSNPVKKILTHFCVKPTDTTNPRKVKHGQTPYFLKKYPPDQLDLVVAYFEDNKRQIVESSFLGKADETKPAILSAAVTKRDNTSERHRTPFCLLRTSFGCRQNSVLPCGRPTPRSEATPTGLRVAEGSGAGGLNEPPSGDSKSLNFDTAGHGVSKYIWMWDMGKVIDYLCTQPVKIRSSYTTIEIGSCFYFQRKGGDGKKLTSNQCQFKLSLTKLYRSLKAKVIVV